MSERNAAAAVRCLGGLLPAFVCTVAFGAQPDTSRFVPDVVGQFEALSVRADALGFHLDHVPAVRANVDKCRHWQGLWRHHAADGTTYFYVTRSQNRPGFGADVADFAICGFATTGGGDLAIVRFGSRDKSGERMRSNRLAPGISTQDSSPAIQDQAVRAITFDGTGGWPAYDHPGGMQEADGVLAIAMEAPLAGSDDPTVAIEFLDIRNPENPVRLKPLHPEEDLGVFGVQAGLVGLTRQANGRYLLVVTGKKNERLWFFESKPTEQDGSTDLRNGQLVAWEFLNEWRVELDGQSLGADWPTDPAHQTLHFLREGSMDGQLYLAGARGKYGLGDDLLDLYRVERQGRAVTLRHVSTRHKISYASADGSILNTGGANQASFAAASAYYVSPSGELLFYATEHDNDGPFESVKAGEWRHIDMVRPDSPLRNPSAVLVGPHTVPEGTSTAMSAQGRQPLSRAWMQFWQDEDYTGRYVVVDHDDRFRDDFGDFKDLDGIVDGFSDEASSWRWFAPQGCTMRANDDDFGDSDFPGEETRTLVGDGEVRFAPNLENVRSDNGEHDMFDSLTSAQFFADCDEYYGAPINIRWDLDRNGTFETGAYSVVFDSTQLDGPSEVVLPLQAVHPVDGRTGASAARITVTNVPPQVFALRALDTLGQQVGVDVPFVIEGLETVLEGEFFDQGRLDTHTASILWGDGARDEHGALRVFTDSTGGATGRVLHTHRFAAAGDYQVELEVVDDDSGVGSLHLPVPVVGIDQALAHAVQEIAALLGATTDPGIRKLLEKAREALAGRGGALTKLDRASLVAALNKLRQAAENLGRAGSGADVAGPLSVVALVAQAAATAEYEAAAAANPDPDRGRRRQLEQALEALQLGNAALGVLDHETAIEHFRKATALSQAVRRV